MFTILDGSRANGGWVRTCPRLGEREAGFTCAFYGGNEVFFLLPFVTIIENVVGAATKHKGHKGFPQFHEDKRCHYGPEVCTPVFLRGVDAPEAHLFGFHLEGVIT